MSSRPPSGTPWVRVEIYASGDQKEASNVFWLMPTGDLTFDLPTIQSDTHDLVLAYITALQQMTSTEWKFRGGNVEWNDGLSTIGLDSYQGLAGEVTGTPMPEDVAAVVQKISGHPGPSGRGRWYFAGLPSSWADGSYLTAANITTINAQMTIIVANKMGQGQTLEAAHFSPTTGQIYQIAAFETVALLGTRRRRRGPF